MGVYQRPLRSDELMHFGILGMKWGVRRYQNYDGSYTQKGMEHYRQSEKNYNEKKQTYTQSKKSGTATKETLKQQKSDLKSAERQLKRDYKQLKRDKAGDKGKELYQTGHTITNNQNAASIAATIAVGGATVTKYLYDNGQKDYAKIAAGVTIGAEVVNGILAAKGAYQNHYLRAYYGHSRPKTNPGRK